MKKYKRSNGKFYDSLTLADAYKAYKNKVKKSTMLDVDYKQYRKVCELFNSKISEHMLKGGIFYMPHRNGELYVKKYKMRHLKTWRLPIDWVESKKRGKRIYHFNEHTANQVYKFCWHYGNLRNTSLFGFTVIRQTSRKLAKMIKEGTAPDYLEH